MTYVVQLVAILAPVWVLRTAVLCWAEIRQREADIAHRRVDLEFDQFETIKEHHRVARAARAPSGTLSLIRRPDDLC